MADWIDRVVTRLAHARWLRWGLFLALFDGLLASGAAVLAEFHVHRFPGLLNTIDVAVTAAQAPGAFAAVPAVILLSDLVPSMMGTLVLTLAMGFWFAVGALASVVVAQYERWSVKRRA